MEIYMLAARCHEKKGNNEEALKWITKNEGVFLDRLFLEETYGRLYQKTKKLDKATHHYENLLQLNSVNYETYYKLLSVKGVEVHDQFGKNRQLTSEEEATVFETLDYYRKGFPKVDAHVRIGLTYLNGKVFDEYLETYVKPLLIKGVPSVI
jgi:tetratricopeptide (TPR) repeat protein